MENIGGQWPWGKWSRQEALSIIIFMLQFMFIAPLSNFLIGVLKLPPQFDFFCLISD